MYHHSSDKEIIPVVKLRVFAQHLGAGEQKKLATG
jgi:hypothetical protein